MDGWTLLGNVEHENVWSRFYKGFVFKPSINSFPSYNVPTPFIKYDISSCNADELIRDFEEKSAMAFQECTQPGELMYALDWQHDCYLVDSRLGFPWHVSSRVDDGDWVISIYPDGDYHFFLARNFSWGILGHPWEMTITIHGEKLINSLLKQDPPMLKKVLLRS